MRSKRAPASSVAGYAAIDVALVVVFVLIGRRNHDEGLTAFATLTTAWPFLVGLVIGWLVTRAWRAPRQVVWTGIGVWILTVGVGMVLRAVSGQGTAISFVVVATVVLGVFLVGWRAVALLAGRRRSVPA